MKTAKPARQLIRRLVRQLYIFAALVVIVLAIGVGAFRLVVTQLPSYRGEIQAWAEDALGLSIDFSRVDARWALLGPELTLYDATVSIPGAENEPIFSAIRASIGLSATALVTDWRLAVSRLIVEETRVAIERAADGSLGLRGAPTQQAASVEFQIEDLPPVEVIARNSTVVFEDRVRDVSWEFLDVGLRLARDGDRLQVEARADAPAELATRIDVTAEGGLTANDDLDSDWRIVAELRDLDLSALPDLYPDGEGMPRAGVGDISLWLDFIGNSVVQATAQLTLEDLQLAESPVLSAADTTYENLAGTMEWSRQTDGWHIALSNLNLRRKTRSWPGDVTVDLRITESDDDSPSFELKSSFVRLEDLTPFIDTLPQNAATAAWMDFAPRGDLLELSFGWDGSAKMPTYSAAADFRDIAVSANAQWPGVEGLSGELRADSRSGRMALSTRDVSLDWPTIFRQPLDIDELIGGLIWRQGQDGVRLVSDNLTLNNSDVSTVSNFELTIPPDGSSPRLELETSFSGFDATITSHYLPAGALPAPVVAWLDRSIASGHIPGAELEFVGPLAAFPFYRDEGRFRAVFDVENGVLDFVEDWPEARDIYGTVEFLNEGFTAQGTATVVGDDNAMIAGGIEDMRNAVLWVDGQTNAPMTDVLGYFKEVPLFAQRLGPDLTQLEAGAGTTDVDLFLSLPLTDFASYELDAELDMHDGELRVAGFPLAATEIEGPLNISEDGVTAAAIDATLLDGPVTASISRPLEDGYRAQLDFDGEVAAESVGNAFELPISDYLAGLTRWQGTLLLPSNPAGETERPRAPLRVSVASNLSGVALKFPAPLEKLPSDATNFQVDFAFPQPDLLDIVGNLGGANRFSFSLWNRDDGLSLRRGSVRFGGSDPLLPPEDGLDIRGSLGQVDLDDWFAVFDEFVSAAGLNSMLSAAEIEFADFSVLDQRLGQTTLVVQRASPDWLIDIRSDPVTGQISVPIDLGSRAQIIANMQQLHLVGGDSEEPTEVDPRELPGLLISAADFAFGVRRYGTLEADVQTEPMGLKLASLQTSNEGFALEGSGDWFMNSDGALTRMGLTLRSENVAAALDELGLDPILEGESAEVSASVSWPGSPPDDWRQAVSGDVSLQLSQGSVLDLEPGAGRMMGLMSITELPRRLALDFRDVLDRGLVFDAVSGTFVLIDGNAYTDNLLLTGPVADIGVVGRTGIKDQTYQQQAVVTAEPGKILPAMGFLAGPGVGTALLIFTQIFKEPLKGIGRASYCMSGTWNEPLIERLSDEDLASGELCADLPPGGLNLEQE